MNRNGTQKCIGDGVVMTSRPAPREWHLAYETEMRAHTHMLAYLHVLVCMSS